MDRGLHQNALQRAIHLRREKVDLCLVEYLAGVVRQLNIQSQAHLAGAFRGNVDVGLHVLVLVHRGEHRSRRIHRRSKVAQVHRDVAHHAIKRRANGVVGQLLLLRLAQFYRRLVIRLGVAEGLLRLVVDVATRHAGLKEFALPLNLYRVVIVDGVFLPLGGAR